MTRFEPHDYQRDALSWLIGRTLLSGSGGGALFLDPGLGKTAVSLAWIRAGMALHKIRKVLIIAPLRVVYSVWPAEAHKWDQFRDLRISIVHGTRTQRMAALSAPADLFLINPEGTEFLRDYYANRPVPFDALIIDESSKFKSWGAKRTKALRKLLPQFLHRIILTGTPSPNSLEDLFPQVFCVDLGESLGTGVSKFRSRYFYRGGFGGYKWIPHETSQQAIELKIKHLCLRLNAEDYLDLPELLINDIPVSLPDDAREKYDQLEKEMFLAIDEDLGQDGFMTPDNAGARYQACKQLAGGGVYDAEDKSKTHEFHTAKVEAVDDIIGELQGKPAIIAYQYKHDLKRLRKRWPKMPSIDGSTSGKQTDALVRKWNAGKLPLLAVQPQALSHGVNMQSGPGRDLIWYGLTDNLETYLQLNARLYRQGVTGQVRIHRLLTERTVDEAVADRINRKDATQTALLDALDRYRKGKAE